MALNPQSKLCVRMVSLHFSGEYRISNGNLQVKNQLTASDKNVSNQTWALNF